MSSTNPSAKSNLNLNPVIRTTGSGRLKRPSRDLTSLNTSAKKPFLKQYSTAMEQKLQNLKEKINQKKLEKTKDDPLVSNKKSLDIKLQKFLKTKTKPQQKNLQQTIQLQINQQKLTNFLIQNNLLSYQSLLIENQIDSLEILADATQKQLEEIGIPKGHALKLKVNISKWGQSKVVQEKNKNLRETKTKDSDRNNSFVSVSKNCSPKVNQKQQDSIEKKVESICIGTEQDGMESIRFVSVSKPVQKGYKSKSKFCLFCYQSIKVINIADSNEFCTQECSQKYNQMFKKYENNLVKAEQEFKKEKPQGFTKKQGPHEQPEENQNQEDEEGFDFLEGDNNYEDFDYEDYERLRKELGSD